MKVIVTRPAAQATEWVRRLRLLGLEAMALPLIGIAPADDLEALRAAWGRLGEQRLLVFVSPNAAEHFFAARPAGAAWPSHTLAASTGPGTSQALLRLGVPPERLIEPAADAPQFDSEALWAQLATHDWHGARVLVVRGDGGRDWLAETMRSRGALLAHLTAYRRVTPSFGAAEQALLNAALADPGEHLWHFSSSEAIAHLVAAMPDVDWRKARAIATHPRIAARARDAGFGEVTLVRPELEAVAACIQSLRPRIEP